MIARAKTVTKDEAETLKFLMEAEMFQQRAEEYRNTARKELHLARKEEHYVENARISTANSLRQEKLSLAQNHHHHEYWFNDGVDEETALDCIAQMAVWHRQDPKCAMTVKINSPGGSVFDGMHLFDEISAMSLRTWDKRKLPRGAHHTTVIGRGMTASMAGILLQAFDTRIVGPECWVLIHEISTYSHGKISEIKEDSKFWDKVSDRVADIFVRRSAGKITKATFKRKWNGKDWWMSSEEALGYGFVDAIG